MAKKEKDEIKKKKKKNKELVKSTGLDLKPKKAKKNKDEVIDVSGGASDLIPTKKKTERVLLPVDKDDFIVVRVGKKNKLCFAHSPKRNTAYIEDTMNLDEPVTVEYDADTLIANLGKDPAPGKAYGVDIQPHYGDFQSDIGNVHLYRKLDDDEKKALTVSIKKIVKKVEEQGLAKVFPIKRVEILNQKGRWAGEYKISNKTGEVEDVIRLFPKILSDQIHNQYIWAHELGHAVWFRYVPDRLRSEWLEMYNESTKVSKAKKSQMEDLCTALVSSQQSVREFQRDIEEEELAMFKEALSYLKKIHKMSPEDVNILLNQNSKVLVAIWPTTASISNNESLCGDYAKVSVHELFAEAYAFYTTGKQVPKSIQKLLEKTIKAVKASDD